MRDSSMLRNLSSKSAGIAITFCALASLSTQPGLSQPPDGAPRWHEEIASSQTLKAGDATLQVDFAAGPLDLPQARIVPWIERAAQAVTVYYGRFPVPRTRILIVPVADR